MKQVTSLSLLLVLMGTLAYNVVQIGVFISNQEEITELFCINKDKPELKCNGKCHLTKKLIQSSNTENKENGVLPAPSLPLLIVYPPTIQEETILFKDEKESKDVLVQATLEQLFELGTPPPEFAV